MTTKDQFYIGSLGGGMLALAIILLAHDQITWAAPFLGAALALIGGVLGRIADHTRRY